MKTFASILMMAIAVTFTANAQQNKNQKGLQNRPEFSVEQHTMLALKRMTLNLDLSEKQQNQIKPLLQAQANQRIANMEKMKAARVNKQKPSADELFAMQNQRLDHQIMMKTKMKEVLTKEQFEKFEKLAMVKKMQGKKMMDNRNNSGSNFGNNRGNMQNQQNRK